MSETFKCIDCGRNFILSYSEQRYYRERGWTLPRRCDACRSQRRQHQPPEGSPAFLEKPKRPYLNGSQPHPQIHPSPQKLFAPKPEVIPGLQPPQTTPRQPRRMNPYYRFGLLSLGLALLLVIIIVAFYGVSGGVILLAWLLAINLVTLVVYRYDKLVAGKGYTRVPEVILLGLALLGGSPMAYVAMYQLKPRHKTQSPNFLLGYWAIIALQIVASFLYFGL